MDPVASTILAASAAKGIDGATKALTSKISIRFARDRVEELIFLLNKGLPAYLEANYARCETIKTLLNRNDPIELELCFVAPNFRVDDTVVSAEQMLQDIYSESRKTIVTGLAGSGKSIFLKHSFRRVLQRGYSYYPIFFELRSLNRSEKSKGFLLTAIFDSISAYCPSFTKAQFKLGLKQGAFYFLLDGFDEISQDFRAQIAEEISEVARSSPKCAIIVSSRPSEEFISWEGFTEAKLLPFNLDQAVNYISKLKFDEEKKTDFIEDLKRDLYEKNRGFLSNPLLAAMMLLTYDTFGEIPERRHIFYAKCFEVLAREHDSSKARYKRELFSSLSIDQIERVFMFFCAHSYFDRIFSFTIQQMREYVRDALDTSGESADIDCIIRDFRESISILELDGGIYEFSHRSFQEYFYARFVIIDRRLTLTEKIDWLIENSRYDDTIPMIAEMDRTYFEDDYLIDSLATLNHKISLADPLVHPSAILSRFFSKTHAAMLSHEDRQADRKRIYYTMSNKKNNFLRFHAHRMYGPVLELEPIYNEAEYELQHQRFLGILEDRYGGEVKIHHRNELKLIDIGAHQFALTIQKTIAILLKHLRSLQSKRKSGMNALIKKRYQTKK